MKTSIKAKASVIGAAALVTLSGCASDQEPRSIVVYYSASGATETVAKLIQEKTGADIVEITPTVPYGGDFDAINEAFRKEMEQGVSREIEPLDVDFTKYDTVYVGTPVWYGRCAGPVETFLKTYSLKEKMVYPFCTFGSGGNTAAEMMKRLQPEAHIDDWYGVRNARLYKAGEELDRFLARIAAPKNALPQWPSFSESKPLDETERAIFDEACGDYPMPLGTPVSVASRDKGDVTEYLFETEATGFDGKPTTQSIYVIKGKADGSVAEFTQVVR
jgi:flavodoxin